MSTFQKCSYAITMLFFYLCIIYLEFIKEVISLFASYVLFGGRTLNVKPTALYCSSLQYSMTNYRHYVVGHNSKTYPPSMTKAL